MQLDYDQQPSGKSASCKPIETQRFQLFVTVAVYAYRDQWFQVTSQAMRNRHNGLCCFMHEGRTG